MLKKRKMRGLQPEAEVIVDVQNLEEKGAVDIVKS